MSSVEYSIRLQDMASPAMRRFTATVQQSNGVVNGASRNMLRRFASTYRAIEDNSRAARNMARDVATLTRQVEQLAGRLERAVNVRPRQGSFLGDLVKGNILSGALAQVGQIATQGVGNALNAAFERQKLQASYNILAGGKAQGEALVGELKQLMRDTMLGSEVFGAAQTMMAFGVQGDISKRIEQIGNVAIGDAQKLQSLALALSQMSASGKLQGQDRLQMVNAGWNPIKTLAEMTGKSVAVLNEEMSKGLISSDMVWKALDYVTREGGTFGGVLDAIAKTPAGQQMLMMGQLDELLVEAGNAMMPIAIDVMRVVNDYVVPLIEVYMPRLREAVQWVWGVLTQWLTALAPLKEIVAGITTEGTTQWEYLQGMKRVWEALIPVVSQLLGFVARFAADIVGILNNSESLKMAWQVISWLLKAAVTVIGWAGMMLEGLWRTVLKPIIDGIQSVVNIMPRLWRGGGSRAGKGKGSSMPGQESSDSDVLATAQAEQVATMQSANAASASALSSSVSSGGPKVVNVSVGKLLDSIVIQSSTLREGAEEVEKIVLDTLARVLAQGAMVAVR